ncbi:MAG TPA: site-specific DNA-methyltransferase [Phycisphaerales bacterium]|nr:site-specific DNA-methyltransferase [Phycisphaerales bacterium]
MYRIPEESKWPQAFVDRVINDDALNTLAKMPDRCVALIVTSPPYWNVVDYGIKGQIGQTSYEQYISDLVPIWEEAERVLIPNGKLAIVTPIMPIPKKVMNSGHTRHLKNINNDIEQSILRNIPALDRLSLFVWQKQTSVKMFGSYPFPPNIYEDNTIEFINVYVKQGAPPGITKEAKVPSELTQEEWRNLTMQIWPMYPEDVQRAGGHPAPFPVVLPQRLIMMYTFKECPDAGFAGDIVLDMFNGAGATCVAARALGRRWIGIDLHGGYCEIARNRVRHDVVDPYCMMLQTVRVRGAKSSRQLVLFADSVAEQ